VRAITRGGVTALERDRALGADDGFDAPLDERRADALRVPHLFGALLDGLAWL
jgi:hypothetical protein